LSADLALIDEAALVRMQELDRVLDGDDVRRAAAVRQIQYRGQRGGLAGAGRAGDQDKAAGQVGEAGHRVGHAELVERLDRVWNGPEHGTAGVALHVQVAAVPGDADDAVREVQLLIALERLPLVGADRRAGQQRGVGGVQLAEAGQRAQGAVDPDHRRRADGQMQVGTARLDEGDQHQIEDGQITRRVRRRVNRCRLLRHVVVEGVHLLHRQSLAGPVPPLFGALQGGYRSSSARFRR
jgi:hypothetical protein